MFGKSGEVEMSVFDEEFEMLALFAYGYADDGTHPEDLDKVQRAIDLVRARLQSIAEFQSTKKILEDLVAKNNVMEAEDKKELARLKVWEANAIRSIKQLDDALGKQNLKMVDLERQLVILKHDEVAYKSTIEHLKSRI